MTSEISKDYGTQYAETVLYGRETHMYVTLPGRVELVSPYAVPSDVEIPAKYRTRGATDAGAFWDAFRCKVREMRPYVVTARETTSGRVLEARHARNLEVAEAAAEALRKSWRRVEVTVREVEVDHG